MKLDKATKLILEHSKGGHVQNRDGILTYKNDCARCMLLAGSSMNEHLQSEDAQLEYTEKQTASNNAFLYNAKRAVGRRTYWRVYQLVNLFGEEVAEAWLFSRLFGAEVGLREARKELAEMAVVAV